MLSWRNLYIDIRLDLSKIWHCLMHKHKLMSKFFNKMWMRETEDIFANSWINNEPKIFLILIIHIVNGDLMCYFYLNPQELHPPGIPTTHLKVSATVWTVKTPPLSPHPVRDETITPHSTTPPSGDKNVQTKGMQLLSTHV